MKEKILVEPLVLLCAFRYSLGRMTYITSCCEEWMSEHWASLAPWHDQIHDDIKKAIAQGQAGHNCDIEGWRKILALPATPKDH